MPAKVGLFGRGRFKKAAGRVKTFLRSRTELLIDGDQTRQFGIIKIRIRETLEQLHKSGHTVQTTAFASPERAAEKTFKKFCKSQGILVKAAAVGGALGAELLRLAKDESKKDSCLALLTSNTDFVEPARSVVSLGRELIVFLPERAPKDSIQEFESTGALLSFLLRGLKTQSLETNSLPDRPGRQVPEVRAVADRPGGQGLKVRAVLGAHGGGTTKTAEPWTALPMKASDAKELDDFLNCFGYRGDGDHIMPSIAKFQFIHRFGDLTIFPAQCGCEEILKSVRNKWKKTTPWVSYSNNLAFFLPTSSPPSKQDPEINELGGETALRVHRGGGPFVIHDSPNMVAQALSMMGYLDYELNADLAEAMLTFINTNWNESILRKNYDALPSPDDTTDSVLAKLRGAFLSHSTPGMWQLAPGDEEVRQKLHQQGFLKTLDAPRFWVLRSMRKFVQTHNLPEMRSYNGYVLRVLSHQNQTQLIEFRTC